MNTMIYTFRTILFLSAYLLTLNLSATVRTVTHGNASGAGSLSAVFTASGAGDTILVNSTTVPKITHSISAFAVMSDLYLVNTGPGLVEIDADGSNAHFVVTGGHFVIDGFFLNNGSATNGGAINNQSELTMRNCRISSCTATNNGGAIFSTSGSEGTCLETCRIDNNTATHGGGIYIDEGGALIINNSSIQSNTATSAGAGIYLNSDEICSINNSTFSINMIVNSGSAGGGIFVSSTVLGINNCTFKNNMASEGGGIHIGIGSLVTLQNSIMAYNVAGVEGKNILGTITASGYNLIRDGEGMSGMTNGTGNNIIGSSGNLADPGLSASAESSDLFYYWSLEDGSDAINSGQPNASETDQLGYFRNGTPDRGAVEYNGCASFPSVEAHATKTLLCDGETVILTGNGATTYEWNQSVENGVAFTPSVGVHNYIVTGYDEIGCSASDNIAVEAKALPDVTAAASQNSLCVGESLTLTGSGASSYDWSDDVVNGVAFTPAIGSITYTVTGTDEKGCVNTATVDVTVDACSTTATQNTELNNLLDIYPNPAKDYLNISLKTDEIQLQKVELINLTGKVVISEKSINGPDFRMNLNKIPKGMYIIMVHTGEGLFNQKIAILQQ